MSPSHAPGTRLAFAEMPVRYVVVVLVLAMSYVHPVVEQSPPPPAAAVDSEVTSCPQAPPVSVAAKKGCTCANIRLAADRRGPVIAKASAGPVLETCGPDEECY